MSKEMRSEKKFTSPAGRLSFPHVFKPRAAEEGGKAKYSVALLLPKDGDGVKEFIKGLQAEIKKLETQRWPSDKPRRLIYGVKNGDTLEMNDGTLKKDEYPEYEGCWALQLSSVRKPGVVDKNVDDIMEEDEIYAGCWARCTFNLFTFANKNKGVSCGLNNLQKLRDDDSFAAGASNPKDDFGPVGGGDQSADEAFGDGAAEVSDDDMFG